MNDKYYGVTEIRVFERTPDSLDDRQRVVLLLETTSKRDDLKQIEFVMDPDLAARHGQALVDLGKKLQEN